MQVRVLLLLATVALATGVAAGQRAAQPAEKVSFRGDIQRIFDENCVSCHQSGSAEQGLVLEGGRAFQNIVRVPSKEAKLPLVSPGQPDRSYLLAKLMGSHVRVGGRGAQMPLGDPLSPASIRAVRNWIAAGSPRN